MKIRRPFGAIRLVLRRWCVKRMGNVVLMVSTFWMDWGGIFSKGPTALIPALIMIMSKGICGRACSISVMAFGLRKSQAMWGHCVLCLGLSLSRIHRVFSGVSRWVARACPKPLLPPVMRIFI